MQGRDDIAGFIAGFAGDDRYIVDYLVEEVLQRQPGHVRSFLLQTSILGRLSGPLADAVTGQEGGKATLESLDRGNLFLVRSMTAATGIGITISSPTSCGRGWRDEQPDRVKELHQRPPSGTSRTASDPRPSATHWLPRTSTERRP